MSTLYRESLRTTQRARRVAVMMMVSMRPEMIRDGHLPNKSLAKPAFAVNPGQPSKNRYAQRIFWIPARIDFPSPLRYF
jgi:hypothetical protein